MGHNVLKPCFPMIGFDLHGEMAVPLILTPSFPHVCFSILNGIVGKVDKTSTVTHDGGWMIVRRTSDIGNLIPHVPLPPAPSFLFLPLIIAFSGSKSYFGPASVQAQGKVIGCALIFVVDINGNCWDILSAGIGLVAPTGVVITWNTVETTLTWGDVLGGFIAMAIDAACTALLSFLGGKLAGRLSGPILKRMMGTRLGSNLAWRLIGKHGLFAMPMVTQVLEKTLGGVALFLTGSPLGHSLPGLLGSPYDAGSLGTAIGYDMGNAITGDGPSNASTSPSTPTPSSPQPTPGPTPTPAPTAPTPTSTPTAPSSTPTAPSSTPSPNPTPAAPSSTPSPNPTPTAPSSTPTAPASTPTAPASTPTAPSSTPPPGNGSVQETVGTADGNVPTPAEQEAQRAALQQPVPERTPQPGQPGGDLANQPLEEW